MGDGALGVFRNSQRCDNAARDALELRFARTKRKNEPVMGSLHAREAPSVSTLGVAEVGVVGQVTKGVRWMPRRQEAKKDVVGCEKPRGAAKQA